VRISPASCCLSAALTLSSIENDKLTTRGQVTLGGTLSGDAAGNYVPDTEEFKKKNTNPAKWLLIQAVTPATVKGSFSTSYIQLGDKSTNSSNILVADYVPGTLVGGNVAIEGLNVYLVASARAVAASLALLFAALLAHLL